MQARGLFITGTDKNVGKTYVASLIVRQLVAMGVRVGVYKPAASGCRMVDGECVSDDALALWDAAGRPGELNAVCPQRFIAPLAPYLAARAEDCEIDVARLRTGVEYWQARSEFVVVEGAGGLLSPLADHYYVADLAAELGYPLVMVATNRIGVINQVLQTLQVARTYAQPLSIAGVILNEAENPSLSEDPSRSSNLVELNAHAPRMVLGQVQWGSECIAPLSEEHPIDWLRF